jgi:hypothetical protein
MEKNEPVFATIPLTTVYRIDDEKDGRKEVVVSISHTAILRLIRRAERNTGRQAVSGPVTVKVRK